MGWNVGMNKDESSRDPWKPATSNLQDILAQAGNLYGSGGMESTRDGQYAQDAQNAYGAFADGSRNVTADQITGMANQMWDPALEQSMRNSATQSTNQAFANIDNSAGATGNAGSSRTGLAQAATASNIQNDLNTQFGQLRQSNLNNAANTLQSNNSTMMSGIGAQAQSGAEASNIDYENQQAKLKALQDYYGIVSGVGGMGGSSSSSGMNAGLHSVAG